jgi:hypothetical protein
MSAALKSTPPPAPSCTEQSVALRERLIGALKADLIGPFAPPSASREDDATEVLPQRPTRWYLTGFLTPETARDTLIDPATEEEPAAGDDKPTQDANEADQGPKIKHRWPASLGMSVLLPPGSNTDVIEVTVRFAEYHPVGDEDEPATADADSGENMSTSARSPTPPPSDWRRMPQPARQVRLALNADALLRGHEVPDAPGLHLVGKLSVAQGPELPPGAQALSLFLVNRRRPPEPKRPDEHCIFQVELELGYAGGFLARPNQQGEGADDWDDNVNDLQFRQRCEYGVGHGVAVEVAERLALSDDGAVTRLRTTWLPRARVKRVKTRRDERVETRMHALAKLETADQVRKALSPLPLAYGEWIAEQRKQVAGLSQDRANTVEALMDHAEQARDRIAAGIELVATQADVRRAFQAANRAMGIAAEQRSPGLYGSTKPEWHLFQLAFILLNVESIALADHPDRDLVELIFFPTGGGKTEAYLGVIAFTLVLRRLRGQARADQGLGVAVILRYTLRLLTLDQLSRASTLICALERLRKEDVAELGRVRFSMGLWVGRSATANTMKAVAFDIKQFNNDQGPNAVSPFPLTQCPWCRSEHVQAGGRPFDLKLYPDRRKSDPERVVVSCTNWRCDFSEAKDPNGVPVVFVDEQIYRELPSFVVATVDKFAMMPWRGEIGLFFGRAQALQVSDVSGSRNGQPTSVDVQFFGPMAPPPRRAANVTPLAQGLLPPELIVQDELHLISGPLGTMVGLYETAIDALCTHAGSDGPAANDTTTQRVRPKILAATATVRRSEHQVKALYARERRLFPPPGVDESETFFAEVDDDSPGRLYLGVAAPGRAMKAILLRTYVALLAAAQKHFDPAGPPEQAADAYMTLAGYFNSLRELGGMRRLVEDDVRARVRQAERRKPKDWTGPHPWSKNRVGWLEPVELTSREKTEKIKQSKARLAARYVGAAEPVDVLLASNMISVGVDIDRLGLMVVAGQPKTTSEYIQASSRVGRHKDYPGLVVTCFNVMRPRDRSHFERFTAYHESFYRHVEASSVTPFSGPALDRGLAGTLVALLRLGAPELTPPGAAMDFGAHRPRLGDAAVQKLVDRALEHKATAPGEDFSEQVRLRARKLLDHWEEIIADAKVSGALRTYSGFDIGSRWTTAFLHLALEERPPNPGSPESHFVAPTSLRDVEPTVPLWLPGTGGH